MDGNWLWYNSLGKCSDYNIGTYLIVPNEKYKQYIEPGFEDQGLMINSPKAIDFLDRIFGQVLIHIPGFEYSQIKWKFGSSRFYVNNVPIELINWIEHSINKFVENAE